MNNFSFSINIRMNVLVHISFQSIVHCACTQSVNLSLPSQDLTLDIHRSLTPISEIWGISFFYIKKHNIWLYFDTLYFLNIIV